MRTDPYERLIRWYPARWRERYGGEMTALLEDRYAAAADVPLRDRIGLARAGVAERARDAGLVGPGLGDADRLRTGSVLVLCGWALFLAAGAIFGKFTDNWLVGTRKADPWVASTSYHAVVVAGAAGVSSSSWRPSWSSPPSSGWSDGAAGTRCAAPCAVPSYPERWRWCSWAERWHGHTI